MRVGISLTSNHAVNDPRDGARWMIERAAAARQSGLDSLFVGDHHSTPAPYYQNVPILGRLLAEWGDAHAGCLFLLPLWNPVLVAEQVGTLASIARGPFIVQCGLGYDEAQFAAMGTRLTYRPSAFEESLSIVQRLLRGETVSSSGRFVFRDARVALRPAEAVDFWVGASAAPAIDRAARLAEGWLASPSLTLEEARSQASFYLERCKAYGRVPAAVAIRRDIYQRQRWIAQSLYNAFVESKRRARTRMRYAGSLSTMLPWLIDDVEEIDDVFGGDAFPYGLEANRATLQALIAYMVEQHFIARAIPIEDLFVPLAGAVAT